MLKNLLIGLTLIFLGSYLASEIQTQQGQIEIQDVRFQGQAGQTMSGLLYLPAQATATTPQPGILAVHGYINSRETQSGFAIEYARRGFVVLALDQTGHGYSDGPAFVHGFGGPDALRYLISRPEVDKNHIGLEGHSMGGWTILMAAAAMPEAYSAMVLAGSSTGTLGTPEGTAAFPKNLLLIFSQYDEFSEFMWDAPIPADIVHSEKLKKLFNTDEAVIPGLDYGDSNLATARQLSMPHVTHPGDHISTQVIGQASDWMQAQLKPTQPLVNTDQTWMWKELGTLIALLGLVIVIFPVTGLLLSHSGFSHLQSELAIHTGKQDKAWYLSAGFTALIPLLSYFPLQTIGGVLLQPNMIFSQAISNGIILWMMFNGALSLIGLRLWHGRNQTKLSANAKSNEIMLAFALALFVCAILYLLVIAVDIIFLVDFRFWVVALKLMSASQWSQFFIYLPFFCAFFVSLGLVLHTQLRFNNQSLNRALVTNCLILALPFVILLTVQYLPLLLGGSLAIASQPLLTIVAIQFLPLMLFIGSISTWCFYRTGSVYLGAFMNGILICWYVIAGQATQAATLL